MNNKELLKAAVKAGFNQGSIVTAIDGLDAVKLSADNIEARTNLEKSVPTLESVDNEWAFHYWLVRA